MHPLNQKFDRIVCLSLVERWDKYNFVKGEFDVLGIEVDFHRSVIHPFNQEIAQVLNGAYRAALCYKKVPNEYACTREHYAIVKRAYLEGVESLLVFEDDISFRRDFNDQIEGYLDTVPQGWDLLMFNVTTSQSSFKQVNEMWSEVYMCGCTGAYALSRRGMEYYLSVMGIFLRAADMPMLYMPFFKQLGCYLPNKPLIIQNTNLVSNLREQQDIIKSTYDSEIIREEFF